MNLCRFWRPNPNCCSASDWQNQMPTDDRQRPLSMVSPGQVVKLVEILAERKLRHRLTELGLTPGVELQVMQDQGGPLLVSVYNSRLALGRAMAHKILVEPV